VAKKAPKGTKVTKEFEFKLTVTEIADKGKQAAALFKEIKGLDVEFEAVKDEWKAKIKDREAKRDDLLGVINAGVELRQTESVMVKNFDTRTVEYWVEVEGDWDLVESRAMTESESQTEMSLDKPKKGRSKKAQKHDPVAEAHANGQDTDVGSVIKEETSRRTKHSAVDGATAS
jgi:hypothetical protein